MKSKVVLPLFIAMIISGCTLPNYVPYSNQLGTTTHGSYIMVHLISSVRIQGELISADSAELLILSKPEDIPDAKISEIPVLSVKSFRLYFARPRNYAWAIIPGVVLPLLPFPDPDNREDFMIFHGFFAILTIPVNLTAVGLIYAASIADFSLDKNEVSFRDLKKFARYPQGLPPGTDITVIR